MRIMSKKPPVLFYSPLYSTKVLESFKMPIKWQYLGFLNPDYVVCMVKLFFFFFFFSIKAYLCRLIELFPTDKFYSKLVCVIELCILITSLTFRKENEITAGFGSSNNLSRRCSLISFACSD